MGISTLHFSWGGEFLPLLFRYWKMRNCSLLRNGLVHCLFRIFNLTEFYGTYRLHKPQGGRDYRAHLEFVNFSRNQWDGV